MNAVAVARYDVEGEKSFSADTDGKGASDVNAITCGAGNHVFSSVEPDHIALYGYVVRSLHSYSSSAAVVDHISFFNRPDLCICIFDNDAIFKIMDEKTVEAAGITLYLKTISNGS